MLRRCKELGMDSLAITDHGALYGAIDFYRTAIEEGVRPIIGCEVYVAPGSHRERTPAAGRPYHLTLLAKDNTGYKNLVQLVTRAHLDGFYYKPRVDRELLQNYSTGIVALSGCLNGELPRLILDGRMDDARSWSQWFLEAFGKNAYLELQRHPGMPQLDEVNTSLFKLHKELGIGLVATNDFHYVTEGDAPLQDILICIHTNTTVHDEKRLKMDGSSFYLKSPAEMASLFADVPEAVSNTQRIAEETSLNLAFDNIHLPKFQTPDERDADEYLGSLCRRGLEKRLLGAPNRYQERLQYELQVIAQTRFANYFLVVWDITAFARAEGIIYGVRGSAAASLALYCLGVTDVDPLEYGLIFERFLNVERKEMPDIDMDFQDDRRDEVIRHVVHTYGEDRVAQIITFGTMGPKAAIRDVGRALALPYPDVDRVARLIPARAHSMEEALNTNAELKTMRNSDQSIRRLIDTAQQVEGMVRHVSTHAAGVVISEEPLREYIPLQRPVRGGEGGISMTQFPMEPIAQLGLLKMDFLGLANLTILKRSIDMVGPIAGKHLELQTIPLDDSNAFDLLSSGETADVFQLEGSGMRRYIKELKPSSLAEVSAMVALYRPGPMEHIESYISAKHGGEVRYPHASLEEVLKETYGVIVYQDQVLRIVQIVAGYSLGEADVVRKAMGKKIPSIMKKERVRFIKGASAQGYTQREAEEIFDLIEPFAGYAFNKAHAVSYALIAYWTAYFKANHTVEYMASVLSVRIEHQERVAAAVTECRRLKIPVLAPDVNKSEALFTVEPLDQGGQGIRFGLAAVKNVGEGAVAPLVQERYRDGPFLSIEDLCRRVDPRTLNRRTLECLIKVGALDALGLSRGPMLDGLDRILSLAQSEARLRESGQTTMFDLFGETVETPSISAEFATVETVSRQEKLSWERELLGFDFSGSQFSAIVASLDRSKVTISVEDLDPGEAGRTNKLVVGQVKSVRHGSTRDGRPFAAVMLALLDGDVEVMAWSDIYEQSKDFWKEGAIVQVVGQIRARGDQVSLTCKKVANYELAFSDDVGQTPETPLIEPTVVDRNGNVPSDPVSPASSRAFLRIKLWETEDPDSDANRLREVLIKLLEYPGPDRVILELDAAGLLTRMESPYTTSSSEDALHTDLVELLGPESVEVNVGDPNPE
jgi:DNA polymerase-3 subunit alpha